MNMIRLIIALIISIISAVGFAFYSIPVAMLFFGIALSDAMFLVALKRNQ